MPTPSPLPFVPLILPHHPPQTQHTQQQQQKRGGGGGGGGGGGAGEWQGGKPSRHKVVFDLHLQHLALHQLPSSTQHHQGKENQRGRGQDASSSNQTIPTLPEALLWQGSETRGALKFRLRLRAPPSICLLLDDSHHEIVIPLSNITSLQLLDASNVNANHNAITNEGEEQEEQEEKEEETLEQMERRLRLGGMVLEMGVVQGCQKDFRLREPNRYVRLASLPGSARVAAGGGTVEEGDFTGGAAKLTNLVRMTIHSTVTRELTTAMTSLVVRALKVRDGQPVDLAVFGGHLAHIEQMGGSLASSGLFPMDISNTSGTESEQSDGSGSSSDVKREPVVFFVKKGGVGLPRYRIAEKEEGKDQQQQKEKSNQIVVEEKETILPVEMVFEVEVEKESASTTTLPLPERPSPPTEPRQRSITQPNPSSARPPTLLRRQTIPEDLVFIADPPSPASKQPIPVASLGSPALSHAEDTNARTRLATTPLSIFDARILSDQTSSINNPPSNPTSTSSLPSTRKHSRTSSIATLVLPPSPSPSDAISLSSSSSTHQQHQPLHHRTVSLGAIGDSRPSRQFPPPSSSIRTRPVTDGSLLASAVARASAKALEKSSSSWSSPSSTPNGRDGFGTRGGSPPTSSSSSTVPPLDGIFSQGSFAYQYPSPMSTPSSTCLSLSEEDGDQIDEGRIRTLSFASSSVSREEASYGGGGGGGSGFGRPPGGRGILESGGGRGIWAEGGKAAGAKQTDASVWGGGGGGSATRFASSPLFSTPSTTNEEDFYPTPTPTYGTYPSSTFSHSVERKRASSSGSSLFFFPPSAPPSPSPHTQAHLPSFLRESTTESLAPSSPCSNNNAFGLDGGRTRSITAPSSSSTQQEQQQRPTTPRPSPQRHLSSQSLTSTQTQSQTQTRTRSQPLPPPPSSLFRSSIRDQQKQVLPFYQLIDPRSVGNSGTGRSSLSSQNFEHGSRGGGGAEGKWISSA